MVAKRVPFDEQFKLIVECRSSGLTDHQWCLEHDINPGTFYNWVRRHKDASEHIPPATGRHQLPRVQEIAQLDISAMKDMPESPVPYPDNGSLFSGVTMELSMGGMVLKVTNDVSPGLLGQVLHVMKGLSC